MRRARSVFAVVPGATRVVATARRVVAIADVTAAAIGAEHTGVTRCRTARLVAGREVNVH